MLDDIAQAIRFEGRGCGRSDPLPPYTIETCLADLEAVRQHYGIERWIVGGHSAGADFALAYALEYPERVLGFICISGGRIHNDREWHRIYSERRDLGLETLPVFDYPPNLEVNAEVNRSWKEYIQRPSLLRELAHLDLPGLFLYADQDIRPSWPIEQVAQLLPNASFQMITGADHHIWVTHAQAMRVRDDNAEPVLRSNHYTLHVVEEAWEEVELDHLRARMASPASGCGRSTRSRARSAR